MLSRSQLMGAAALFILSSAFEALHADRSASAPEPSRTFEFTYQVHVPGSVRAATTHLWIPLPPSDAYQDIRDLRIESSVRHTINRDAEYGNSFALLTPRPKEASAGYDVQLRFTATRREHRAPLVEASLQSVSTSGPRDPMLQRYLQPDKLVQLNGVIAELAHGNTFGAATPLEKARRIYDYVIANMRYDKSGEGWGRGDAVWACTSKRGNCTDFHSLFIGMMRASGIPARFEIGFALPEDKTEGDIPGYHCWAGFYLEGEGWVPVDASEAWKNSAKRDYFFGAHDVNRVLFSYGRDIRLSPDQKGAPLNYFIYPYVETDGQQVKDLKTRFAFRDVATGKQ